MTNPTLYGLLLAAFSMVINLITIIKFTNALEKRLTTLEVTQEQILKPQLDKQSAMLQKIFERMAHGRKTDSS